MKGDNLILNKSFQFALQIIHLYKRVIAESDNRILPTQLLKSGTSIGANVREAVRSQSRNEFLAKMNIALKEAYETEYWLELLHQTIISPNPTLTASSRSATISPISSRKLSSQPKKIKYESQSLGIIQNL